MVLPTAATLLVAPGGCPLGIAPCRPCTALCTVNVTAIAVAADENLGLAARAQKQPRRRCRRGQPRPWTRSAWTGIMPRHACSARCGARRRFETWRLRSAPCRPRQTASVLPRAGQAAQAAIRGTRQPVDLWTSQEACPQTHRPNNNSKQSSIDQEFSVVRTAPRCRRRDSASRASSPPPPPLRHLYADYDRRSHHLRRTFRGRFPSLCAPGLCRGNTHLSAAGRRG